MTYPLPIYNFLINSVLRKSSSLPLLFPGAIFLSNFPIFNQFYLSVHPRRRSLSPITLSIIESHLDSTTLTNTSVISAKSRLLASENFVRRRSCTPTRRRFQSIPARGHEVVNSVVKEEYETKPPQKPPTVSGF